MSKFFFSLRVYIYMYSINIDETIERCSFVKMGRKRQEEISFTAIKQRAGLIVNSIDRLRLKLELKLISFFLPFERDNKGDD